MRVAVISDIHANYHALEAVLGEVEAERPDQVWCLGDTVGYGPRPNDCVDRVRPRADVSLVGNHDLAAIGKLATTDFGLAAALSAQWTAGELGDEQRAWLASLEPQARRPEAGLFHGSPRDPVWEYVLSDDVAVLGLLATTEPVVLVGHSHVALAVGWDGERVHGGMTPDGTEIDLAQARWLLNPGSVGQPRDGDPRAAWLLIDFDAGRARFRRVTYAIEQTQAEIRERRLPDELASRLAHGV